MKEEYVRADSPDTPKRKNASGCAVKLQAALYKARGIPVEVDLSALRLTIAGVCGFREETALGRATEGELADRARRIRDRISSAEPRPGDAVEAFALVNEACRRTIGLIPHDVQMIAGLAMAGTPPGWDRSTGSWDSASASSRKE
ncbi:MAG: SecA DEAD-like domain [Candidatus Aminicenantes bacterium]|nr:SecA DEAD-like domain [Candidatus Aminicenantes bacterium]